MTRRALALTVVLAIAGSLDAAAQQRQTPAPAARPQVTQQACEEVCNKSFIIKLDAAQKQLLDMCMIANLCPIKMAPPIANMPWNTDRFKGAI